MLVVTTRDNFIIANEENRPRADLVANAVKLSDLGPHDFGDRWSLQTGKPGCRVAGNQQKLHPERSMSEQGKENVDDSKFRTRQRRAVGIVKVCVSDRLPPHPPPHRYTPFTH